MVFKFIKKWFNYVFKRNPFQNLKEEEGYVQMILGRLGLNTVSPSNCDDHGITNVNYENWLLKIIPLSHKGFIYVKMKSRGTGYIFGPKK